MPLSTIEDLSRYTRGITSTTAPLPLINQWADFRIREVAGQKRMRQYRRFRSMNIPGTYATGTLTTTRDSTTVTGTSTVWTVAHVGWFLRPATAWYRIAQVQSTTALVLEVPFAEDAVSTGAYVMAKRYHDLGDDVSHFDDFSHDRTGAPLDLVSMEELEYMYPSRSTGGLPGVVAESELSLETGNRQVEIHPYSSTSELINYWVWIKPPTLDGTDRIPHAIEPYALVEGIKVDIFQHRATESESESLVQIWLNESRRQNTLWHAKMQEVLKNDPGSSDSQINYVQQNKRRAHRGRPIISAYDQVWYAR